MKTILLLLCSCILLEANSQCTVTDIYVQNVSLNGVQVPGSCSVKFDASFTIENNNGNKYIFLHAWTQQDYPNYFQCVDGHTTLNGSIASPEAGDLGNEFLTIALDNNAPTPLLLTTYTPDPTVPITPVDSVKKDVLPDGTAIIYLFGITTTLPVDCGTPTVIVADLWSSQAASAQRAHCVNCGIRSSSGYLRGVGLVNCATLTYFATLTNNTANALTGEYRIYADVNGDDYFNPAIDTLIAGPANFSLAAGPGTTTAISGPVPAGNYGQDLFLVTMITSGTADGASRVFRLPSTVCSPLPVTFSSFTGRRTSSAAVWLNWETATEVNNSGFILQRNLGNNTWVDILFIPSQATDGNSSSVLRYTYTDMNNHKGLSQYRLQQIDIDGHVKYSNILTVRGVGQSDNTLVYPNPSPNGDFTIVFEDAGREQREVRLLDINGRVIRRWSSVAGNTLQVAGVQPGTYTIQVIVPQTGQRSMNKLVVFGK